MTATVYPDSTTVLGTNPDGSWKIVSGTDHESVQYDRLARKKYFTDQRGVKHRYDFDTAGRLKADVVETLPTGVDGRIRRIETAYDDVSRPNKYSSYSAASGGSVLNQVALTFGPWGPTQYAQAQAGAVVTTPPSPSTKFLGFTPVNVGCPAFPRGA